MTFSYSKDFSTVGFTEVENAFIYEYLPNADGDAVKVYLYGLFLCKNKNYDQPISQVALTLSLNEKTVRDCFKFWEEFGLLTITSEEPFSVQYLPVRAVANGKAKKFKAEKYTDFTKSLQALLPDRMISTNEYQEYFMIMETYGIKPEAMIMIVKYCVDRKGADIGYKYISKVAKDFGARGIVTVEKVEKELSTYILRTYEIEKILSALGLKRQPDIEDQKLLKKWTQELNFETENIIFAASKLKKGSVNKLDEFLMDLYSMKSFSKEEISAYMAQKQGVYDLAIKINKALSVYMEVIDTVVDTYTKKWISYGYDGDTLLYVASQCFKEGKNTLQDMDELIENLRMRGIIDLSSVGDYFEGIKKTDQFISKVLITAGVNRRPNPWDRENISNWKSWNFSEEMILEAAKLSSGKASPIAYMNGILANWKNNGVYSVSDIENGEKKSNEITTQQEYNREYERRRTLAISRAQRNVQNALNIDGFNEVYSRLNSIEKDLAFAEMGGNEEALKSYEKEKQELIVKANEILKTLNITLTDLSPKYACDKCNDTGYVGTHKCDCYNKK